MIASGSGWPDHGRFCQRDLPLEQDNSQNVTYFVHFILLRYFGPNFLSTYSNSTNLPQSRLLLLLLDLDEWAGFSTSPPVKKKQKTHEGRDVNAFCYVFYYLFLFIIITSTLLAFCHCSSSATSSADIKFFSHSLLPEHRGYKVKETVTSGALFTAVLFGQFRCWPGLKSVRIILKRNTVIYFQLRKRIQA